MAVDETASSPVSHQKPLDDRHQSARPSVGGIGKFDFGLWTHVHGNSKLRLWDAEFDRDVAQMRENLDEEANTNTGMRGLEPQFDEQRFEVYLLAAVRDK